jgi:imidazole glycerol-phosphate synthase subunit HisH
LTVSLVDYGLGNLGSVANMLKRIGVESRRVSTPAEVLHSDRVLLPGIGAFDTGMSRLADAGLDDALRDFAATGKPIFGICLGMQLLLDSSEEGTATGLGLIPGKSVRFDTNAGVRIPHMGWNAVTATHSEPLVVGAETGSRFYFVHSYHVVPDDPAFVLATTDYAGNFASMISRENILGAQFHPEKSHAFGMTILRNFAAL